MLKSGLYEQVINKLIAQELENTDKLTNISYIDKTESSKILAHYLSDIIEKGLDDLMTNHKDISSQINLANKLVALISQETKESIYEQQEISPNAQMLMALLDKTNTIYALDGKKEAIRPETSLAVSSLFTGAIHEPSMHSELKKEILSCDRIDMLVSFIKWSGLRLIIEELKTFTNRGGKLRIITTSYMGATDLKAIQELNTLENTEIKISYDTKRTRLHAKSYVFYRESGFTTAYIGSSNLSNAAISSGLEWNIKITQKDLPETLQKIEATFESYLNSIEFETYNQNQENRLSQALQQEQYPNSEAINKYLFDIRPYPYQEEILDKLNAERQIRGHYKNLIIAATGTGKTVISAFDYKSFLSENKGGKLLFVAHREEILKQSISCFQGVLKDPNFGDLFVGNYRPESLEHLFVSVQTFNSQELDKKTSPDFYDYIIIDEFHHAAAPTYQKLLTYYTPKILLGLTATPERMDGKNILTFFDNKIAAEIRLPEAIDRKLLAPFQYFGITDTVNLTDLKWARGGYDKSQLTNIYTLDLIAANRRADMIIRSIKYYVTNISDIKGLGFCVSIAHAEFMSKYFNQIGISSISLTGQSPDQERFTAKNKLVSGEIKFIFVVDIYNEGVDIPEINTVLFLRPTESLTIFLQQLGRGLRLSPNKECLTVLDFIGQANQKYNFEEKFTALLSNTTNSIQKEMKNGFISVPKGCFIQLEKKAKEYILENIKSAFGGRNGIVSRLSTFTEDSGQEFSLTNFINYYHLDLSTIYSRYNLSRLCVIAGIKDEFNEPMEELLTKAFPRICAIDSRRWITFLLEQLPNIENLNPNSEEIAMLQMTQFTIWQKSYEDCGFANIKQGFIKLKQNPTLYSELLEILNYNYEHIDFIDQQIDLEYTCPLDLHCNYTRDQILVALDFMKPSTVREGVKYLSNKKTDLFFITLNKSDKDYSPTTMYNDYSINQNLFHWQSQSTTSETSVTGQRYINHQKTGNTILLFVREYKKNKLGTSAYTFLGKATYKKHQGSRPMNITWKLEASIPAKYLKKTNKLVVG